MKNPENKADKKNAEQAKKVRLAEALRTNLRRRKQQARKTSTPKKS